MRTHSAVRLLGCVAFALLACAACGKKGSDQADAAFQEKTDQVAAIKLGDEAIVESGKASFWRGKITKVEGDKVTYEYGSNHSTDTADKGDVYVIVKTDHKGTEKAGDNVICRTGTDSWEACVVKAVNGAVYVCEDSGGSSYNLAAPDVILPKPATQANIKERIETSARERAFLAAAKAAGKPSRPAGWKARPGADVLALFAGTHWYGGKVTKTTAQKITVAWDDKTSPSERDPEEVAPKPVGPQKVSVGQFVLVRPASSSSNRWDFGKVDKVDGTSVVISVEDGKSRTVTNKDVSPIAP